MDDKHDNFHIDQDAQADDQSLKLDRDNASASAEKVPHSTIERAAAVAYDGKGSAAEKRLLVKQDLRIVPLSAFIYLLCSLDRSNIGNAKVAGMTVTTQVQAARYPQMSPYTRCRYGWTPPKR